MNFVSESKYNLLLYKPLQSFYKENISHVSFISLRTREIMVYLSGQYVHIYIRDDSLSIALYTIYVGLPILYLNIQGSHQLCTSHTIDGGHLFCPNKITLFLHLKID